MANTIKLGNGNWATKEGSLLAYNDENNNFKPLPFTTTRASSATVVNKQGLIETVGSGIPRIDFSDDANGALLLEPTSTNLVVYSEDFTQTNWTNSSGTQLSSTTTVTPSGSTNAVRVKNVGGANNDLRSVVSITSGLTYTNSVYIRRVSGVGNIRLKDVNGGVVYINGLTSEWQKFSSTVLSNSTNGRFYLEVNTLNDEIEVWGAQTEQQSYATSYIKTVGTTQTRVADTATGSGNSTVINSSEGVLYAEMKNDIVQNQTISLRQGTTDSVQLGLINGNIRCAIVSNNSAVLDTSTFAYNNGLINKYAIVWNGTNAKTFINGQLTNTITTPSPLNLDSLDFQNPALAENIVGKIKSVQVYTTALSDAELTSLTTI
tara:strand:+ start:18 stop:1145 length:1128 start_codon:yes stop_codon:yes gene_type:complete